MRKIAVRIFGLNEEWDEENLEDKVITMVKEKLDVDLKHFKQEDIEICPQNREDRTEWKCKKHETKSGDCEIFMKQGKNESTCTHEKTS